MARIHQARLVAPFPQRSRPTMPSVEQARVISREGVPQPRQRIQLTRRHQQVHVIAHQHISVRSAPETPKRMTQALQVALAIQIIQETRQPVVSPLHHVLGNAEHVETRESGHACQRLTSPGSKHRH